MNVQANYDYDVENRLCYCNERCIMFESIM